MFVVCFDGRKHEFDSLLEAEAFADMVYNKYDLDEPPEVVQCGI